MSTFTCNSVSTLIQNFFYFVIFCNGGNKKFFQDYVKNILLGVQHINYVRSDSEHTVISVPNKQVLNNVIDTFKQKSGIAFAIYRKPKDFGDRGQKIRYFRHHIIIFKFRNQTNCTIFRDQTKKIFFFFWRFARKTGCPLGIQEPKGTPYNTSFGSANKHGTCYSSGSLFSGLQLWSRQE